MKYTGLIAILLLMPISLVLGQVNKIPSATPLKYDNLQKIETTAKMSRDSAVILLNNKFYRLSELKEYNNTIDGVNIESIDVVRDRTQITKIVSEKISVLVIVNAAKNQKTDSLKLNQRN